MKQFLILFISSVIFSFGLSGKTNAGTVQDLRESVSEFKHIENEAARFICEFPLAGVDFDYAAHFTAEFIKKVPLHVFKAPIKNVIDGMGPCVEVKKVRGAALPEYNFISKLGNYSTFDFKLSQSGLIEGLHFVAAHLMGVKIDRFADVEAYAATLPGHMSALIQSENSLGDSVASAVTHPLGSAFKLYILGELVDQVKSKAKAWSETHPITESMKSLPSGEMQNWVSGRLVTLKEYAQYMIRISDNTATDHLIDILGREKIENQMTLMSSSVAAKNKPFLKTSEMFKLKWAAAPTVTQKYVLAGEPARREILANEIGPLPLSLVGLNGVAMDKPDHIDEIEWFGTTSDLCRAMFALKNKASSEALSILSQNTPFVTPTKTGPWSYAGFKGGSEPGVLTMTYLLQKPDQKWVCVAVAWHDEMRPVNELVMFDLVKKVLKLAESYQ